ncbi:SseB family protein [Micromonospora sp. LA-10]|uniref:SseB family protein n=1 Tax=Micromonospora sp. LA-10 TaxID=3446364 RepID=UPI003F715A90
MTGWEPATEAEVAMRDALRAQDQQQYFRVLTRVDLFLPVAGSSAGGWGTWTSGGRTHVLAFTSAAALRASLGENAGTARRVPYPELAAGWPNPEWWLAVNPGLPIEGYLPAWYVAQLSRGDIRLPGRTMGARARLDRVESAARSARNGVPESAPHPSAVPVPPAAVAPPVVPPAAVPPPAVPPPAVPPAAVPLAAVPPPAVPPPAVPPPAVPPPAVPASPVPGGRGERRTEHDEPPTAPIRGASVLGRRLPTMPPRRREPDRDGPGRADAGDEPGTDALDGWLTDLRRRPDEPDPFAAPPAPTDEPPAATTPPPPSRSFFEPASGRSTRRSSPLDAPRRAADRATPPTRFAGGQPFPRRRPLNEPVREEPTQAFATRADEPPPVPRTDEATQAFRPTRPPEEAIETLPRRHSGPATPATDAWADPIGPDREAPPWNAAEDPTEALSSSVAEPVSSPPAPRRDFTPIVIEGTVIEARDLTEPEQPWSSQYADPVPSAPADHAAAPWAGAADPTAPLPADQLPADPLVTTGDETTNLTEAAYTVPPAETASFDRTGRLDESTVSFASTSEPTASLLDSPTEPPFDRTSEDPTTSLFGTSASSAEPTQSLFAPSASSAEPTQSLFGTASSSAEPTQSLFEPSASSTEPSESLFGHPASSAEPTMSLFEAHTPSAEPTTSLYEPTSAEPTTSLHEPTPDEPTTSLYEPSPAEPTAPLFAPAPAEEQATVSLFQPATDAEPAMQPAVHAEPTTHVEPAAEPGPATFDNSATTSLFAPGEPTIALSTPDEAPDEAPKLAEPPAPVAEPAPVGGDAASAAADFVPANEVEEELLAATGSGSTDGFLTTLLLARVLLPAAPESAAGSRPGDPGFVWHTELVDGETSVSVYTSPERLAEHAGDRVETVRVKFVQLIRKWPDVSWSFRVNPDSPVRATYPGEQVLALANWAAEVGLGDDPEPAAAPQPAEGQRPEAPTIAANRPVTMQKAIAASQLAYYLERGYDRVSGFVHRAGELAHLNSPAALHRALGLGHPGSPFSPDDEEIYLLRWPAYRPSLYRIPYGGPNESAMRAMEGWVIERPPFRGNGFAPGESSDVIAEFKVDSARLPHGAELWRLGADGDTRLVAVLDTDALVWRKADEA